MSKTIKTLLATLISLSVFASFSATANSAVIPEQCQKLFKETENLIAEAEKQPGTHVQLKKIKSKLNQSKQQILEMEVATQIKSCDIALAKLTSKQNAND